MNKKLITDSFDSLYSAFVITLFWSRISIYSCCLELCFWPSYTNWVFASFKYPFSFNSCHPNPHFFVCQIINAFNSKNKVHCLSLTTHSVPLLCSPIPQVYIIFVPLYNASCRNMRLQILEKEISNGMSWNLQEIHTLFSPAINDKSLEGINI